MTTPTPTRRFGAARGEYALVVALTVVGSFLLPGGGLLVAVLAQLTAVRSDRRRSRTLFVVACCVLVLQIAIVAFAMWGPTDVCASFDGGAETCTTS